MSNSYVPALSVIIPTFNNLAVLKRNLASWQKYAAHQPVELLVIEDGCRDGTPEYLREMSQTAWGQKHLRWFHEDDVHELQCTNRGFAEASAPLLMTWQDDMFLQCEWLVPELIASFDYADIGLLCLSRGLNCFPFDEPIHEWEDLHDPRRLQSTIGARPLNWFRLQEVDIVIRPWVVRRECIEKVGVLDEAFRPTEWDEADLCFRIRGAGWKIATHGYERVGAYQHLGSTTLEFSPQYKERVLRNGQLFHERWDEVIRREHPRPRRTWLRRASVSGWMWTVRHMMHLSRRKDSRLETCEQDT
ncbi:MAG TPA: glycosyltransferase [Pyrinomonadaceae bacterium]|jgi:GT2 family glycosyltransferase